MARPREFEPDDALSSIKDAFWLAGYDGTSMSDIEVATGLKKQSLYRLFGNKRQMYLSALAHYEQNEVTEAGTLLLQKGSARQRFQRLFGSVIDDALATGDARGCFLCNASIDQAALDPETGECVKRTMEGIHQTFIEALQVSPPFTHDKRKCVTKATELLTLYFGVRVLIKSGMPESVLRDAIESMIRSI